MVQVQPKQRKEVNDPKVILNRSMVNVQEPGHGFGGQNPTAHREKYENHWALAAAILDRFFMILFLTVSVVLTIAVLFIMPAVHKTKNPMCKLDYIDCDTN